MKIAIVGGAGVRVPLLVRGLVGSDLGIDRVDLFDIDRPRLRVIADLAAAMAPNARITAATHAESAIAGADFVITSIRVGGAAQRAKDEAAAIALGAVGQETVGPAGFAMAVRTVPAMVEYGRIVARLAPRAWLVNFTNPVSIITQAVHQETGARLIGICDTPMETYEDAAHALGLPAMACSFDYFGLNHLGWLREVFLEGAPQMQRLWDDDARLALAQRSPLFEPERLRALRMLPTEYLYYYYRPDVALENQRRAGTSRGKVVAALTDELFRALEAPGPQALAIYERYLADRDRTYMQIESASTAPRDKPEWAELSGYDRIAMLTMRAIVHNQNAIIPLDVANGATFPFLDAEDIVEVPCKVNTQGPVAERVPEVPAHARELMTRVKEYERATVRAALSNERADLVNALALNPIVDDHDRAQALVDALI